MTIFESVLKVVDSWRVDDLSVNDRQMAIHVDVSPVGGRVVCPETGEEGPIDDHRQERVWRYLDGLPYRYLIHCREPRIPSSSGVQTIAVPWADGSHRFTLFFETWVIDLLLATRNQTAKLLRYGFQTIHGIFNRAVACGMALRSAAPPWQISLDEKAIQKGPCDGTILLDPTQGTVLDLMEGRKITNVQDLRRRLLPKEKRKHHPIEKSSKEKRCDGFWHLKESWSKDFPKGAVLKNTPKTV